MPHKRGIICLALNIFFYCLHSQQIKHLPDSSTNITVKYASVVDSLKSDIPVDLNSLDISKIEEGLYYVTATITPAKAGKAGNIDLETDLVLNTPADMQVAKNSFHWLPNLKGANGNIVAQHVFRSPCIIQSVGTVSVALMPDIELLSKNSVAPYYLDLTYTGTAIQMHYGISLYKVKGHIYYAKDAGSFNFSQPLKMAFYVMVGHQNNATAFLKKVNRFLWYTWASKYTTSLLSQTLPFKSYADTGYNMALRDYWVSAGDNKGGITLSTFYDTITKKFIGRYYKNDLWFQSWFNNIRTACGLYYWGRQGGNKEWQQKAVQCVNLLLDAPREHGWFPTIYNTEAKQWIASGQGGGEGLYHVPDNVWAAYWLMRFTSEQAKVGGAEELITGLGTAVLNIQQADGSFPERIDVATHKPDAVLQSTASSAISTWYLEELLLRKKIHSDDIKIYTDAVKRSLAFLSAKVLPHQKFEDFEVYLSCSPKPFMPYYDSSVAMYAQNTLSIQWCAEAYLKAWQLFNDKQYLQQGEYCLNILSLYQQVWSPPFIGFYAFGGFGAQNSDAEWSDARQAQFAETYLNYYFATNNKEYLERAVAACRASFTLMVIDANKNVSPFTYQGKQPYEIPIPGNMPENYGHSGFDSPSGQSGFHWGTGSALTTAAVFKQRLGDVFIDKKNETAIGVDGVVIEKVSWGNTPNLQIEKLPGTEYLNFHSRGKGQLRIILDGKQITIPAKNN